MGESQRRILGIDFGFGSTKTLCGDENGNISNKFKFSSVVSELPSTGLVVDKNLIPYNGKHYYVGEVALTRTDIINIVTYVELEQFTPLLLQHALNMLGTTPTDICCGLSIVHYKNLPIRQKYQQVIRNYLNTNGLGNTNLSLLPQGVGAKLAFQKYYTTFPIITTEFLERKSYFVVDIGFNTIDVCHVINGAVSTGNVRGIPESGLISVARKLRDKIKENYKIELQLKDCQTAISSHSFMRRGKIYDVSAFVKELLEQYKIDIEDILKQNFDNVIDKLDFIAFVGGGAYLFNNTQDDFYKYPLLDREYYNAIGFYLHLNKQTT